MLADSDEIAKEGETLKRITEAVHGGVDEIAAETAKIAESARAVASMSVQNKRSIDGLMEGLRKFKVR